MVTFIGPLERFSFAGFTFYKGEARDVPLAVAQKLTAHPWFDVVLPEPTRGRPKKNGNQG